MSVFDSSYGGWSLPLFRLRGISVRADWTLLAIAVFELVRFYRMGFPATWWPALLLVIFGSVLLHEFGHAFAARMVGGRCHLIVLWMLGGLAEAQVPMRPWPKFACSFAGPLVNGLLWLGAFLVLRTIPASSMWGEYQDFAAVFFTYAAWVNGFLAILNILPCHPLDGGTVSIAAFWPFTGLRRAVAITIVLAYPGAAGVIAYGAWQQQFLLMCLGLWLFYVNVQAHTAYRMQQPEIFGLYLGGVPEGTTWFSRWLQRRRQRARQRIDDRENAEQELVDQLLEKVGNSGLASLKPQERATLEAYSRKQRQRQEAGL